MSLAELRALAAESYDGVRQKVWTEPDPAAGADFTITVPGPQFWLPVALTATFTASDTDAQRQPNLAYTDGTTSFALIPANGGIGASAAGVFSWVRDYPAFGSGQDAGFQTLPLPSITLPTGWGIVCTTTNIDDADQWSDITLTALQITGGQPAQALRREDAIYEHWQAMNALIGMR